jgi:hypothetical protein
LSEDYSRHRATCAKILRQECAWSVQERVEETATRMEKAKESMEGYGVRE